MSIAEVLHKQVVAEKALSADLEQYASKWVATSDHHVVAHGDSLEAVLALISDREDVDSVFHVAEDRVTACYF